MAAKRSLEFPLSESLWDHKDPKQVSAVKEVLHVSRAPSSMVCREEEQNRVLEFCKASIKQEKAGSLYICGCPGTGKSFSIEKIKGLVLQWAGERGCPPVDVLSITCTSLTNSSEIFSKILGQHQLPRKKINAATSALKQLQKLYSRKRQESATKMMLIIVDELDYLMTKDRGVLHDLLMLTTLPVSRCILIGIANAIDLADRFLPRLQSADCKPLVTFRASKYSQNFTAKTCGTPFPCFPSSSSGTLASLQIIVCSAVKLFRKGKKDTTLGELNRSYMDICRASQIPPVGTLELSSMCGVLSDQGVRFFRNCLSQ